MQYKYLTKKNTLKRFIICYGMVHELLSVGAENYVFLGRNGACLKSFKRLEDV